MKCNEHPKEYWLQQKWGTLKLDPNQELPKNFGMPRRDFKVLCDCGRCSTWKLNNLVRAKSCGKCGYQPASVWLNEHWGNLRLDSKQELPKEWGRGCKNKFNFICSCGKSVVLTMASVTSHNYTRCGKCNYQSKEHLLSQKWGSLKISKEQELPQEIRGEDVLLFLCDCGQTRKFILRQVRNGNNTSCARCGFKPKDYWLQQRWGKLKLDPNQNLPEEWGKGCKKVFRFSCDCGRTIRHRSFRGITADSVTCTKCEFKTKFHWLSQKWGHLKIDPVQKLPNEWGTGYGKIKVLCDCGNKHTTTMSNLIYGYTRSCGCKKQGSFVDSPARKIYNQIKELAPDAKFGYWFKTEDGKRKEYDIYIPSKKLAIEYHGLYWHSEEQAEKRDFEKYQIARHRGDRLIQIYQDEWRLKPHVILRRIEFELSPCLDKHKRIKPIFEIHFKKTPPEARAFLDAHHYLGAASGCLTVIAKADARHGSAVVGVWVFMKREEGVILWHRACWHPAYKAWNPHEKALKLALPLLKEMGFKRIVSFSDNRFHTGQLYEKLGFKFEEEVPPNYYYTNYTVRKNKTKFRIKAGVGKEVNEATTKGWHRIWDSGKKRFSLLIL
jgi:hypothetical protein